MGGFKVGVEIDTFCKESFPAPALKPAFLKYSSFWNSEMEFWLFNLILPKDACILDTGPDQLRKEI